MSFATLAPRKTYLLYCFRESVPKDLIDDMYHVLNAVYCDVYATAERRQAEYASLILALNTTVAIYPGGYA